MSCPPHPSEKKSYESPCKYVYILLIKSNIVRNTETDRASNEREPDYKNRTH